MHRLNHPQTINPNSFAKYLAISVGTGFVATSQSYGEIVNININSTGNPAQDISGLNGGAASGSVKAVYNWPNANGRRLNIYNGRNGIFGLGGNGNSFLQFAFTGGNASIQKFTASNSIGSSGINFTGYAFQSAFKYNAATASNFTSSDYVGFRFGGSGNYYYGWLQTTWDGTNFQINSGAYESTANTAILAGAVPVPEPGTLALGSLALLAGGGAAVRRYRKQRQSQSAAGQPTTEPAIPAD